MSYNTTPGWSAAIPLRHLCGLHLELASGEAQGLSSRIDQSLAFAESVVNSNAAYFRANPNVAEKLKGLKGQNRNYLAHEFFNADWHPMPFSKAAEYLGERQAVVRGIREPRLAHRCAASAVATAAAPGDDRASGVA